MSFYIEISNWDENGPKTFLVKNFNAASKRVKRAKGFFGTDEYGPDPDAVEVEFTPATYYRPRVSAVIDVGYDEFRQTLLHAKKCNVIPSFRQRKP
ncbi:MAG: hypothetical protein GC185_05475 [Alphaproteobacteria bacterium]|nr:hypothetical protein [Alphaproteobacteria bacterium]